MRALPCPIVTVSNHATTVLAHTTTALALSQASHLRSPEGVERVAVQTTGEHLLIQHHHEVTETIANPIYPFSVPFARRDSPASVFECVTKEQHMHPRKLGSVVQKKTISHGVNSVGISVQTPSIWRNISTSLVCKGQKSKRHSIVRTNSYNIFIKYIFMVRNIQMSPWGVRRSTTTASTVALYLYNNPKRRASCMTRSMLTYIVVSVAFI
jgi:hypothetical protein